MGEQTTKACETKPARTDYAEARIPMVMWSITRILTQVFSSRRSSMLSLSDHAVRYRHRLRDISTGAHGRSDPQARSNTSFSETRIDRGLNREAMQRRTSQPLHVLWTSTVDNSWSLPLKQSSAQIVEHMTASKKLEMVTCC